MIDWIMQNMNYVIYIIGALLVLVVIALIVVIVRDRKSKNEGSAYGGYNNQPDVRLRNYVNYGDSPQNSYDAAPAGNQDQYSPQVNQPTPAYSQIPSYPEYAQKGPEYAPPSAPAGVQAPPAPVQDFNDIPFVDSQIPRQQPADTDTGRWPEDTAQTVRLSPEVPPVDQTGKTADDRMQEPPLEDQVRDDREAYQFKVEAGYIDVIPPGRPAEPVIQPAADEIPSWDDAEKDELVNDSHAIDEQQAFDLGLTTEPPKVQRLKGPIIDRTPREADSYQDGSRIAGRPEAEQQSDSPPPGAPFPDESGEINKGPGVDFGTEQQSSQVLSGNSRDEAPPVADFIARPTASMPFDNGIIDIAPPVLNSQPIEEKKSPQFAAESAEPLEQAKPQTPEAIPMPEPPPAQAIPMPEARPVESTPMPEPQPVEAIPVPEPERKSAPDVQPEPEAAPTQRRIPSNNQILQKPKPVASEDQGLAESEAPIAGPAVAPSPEGQAEQAPVSRKAPSNSQILRKPQPPASAEPPKSVFVEEVPDQPAPAVAGAPAVEAGPVNQPEPPEEIEAAAAPVPEEIAGEEALASADADEPIAMGPVQEPDLPPEKFAYEDNATVMLEMPTVMVTQPEPEQPAETKPLASFIFRDGLELKEYVMTANMINIGRNAQQSDLLIQNDNYVGRNHAMVYYKEGVFFLVDLASRNGSWVNGERVNGQTLLPDGSQIQLGQTRMNFTILK